MTEDDTNGVDFCNRFGCRGRLEISESEVDGAGRHYFCPVCGWNESKIFHAGQKVIVSETGDRGVVVKVIKLDDGQNLYLINYKFDDKIIDRFCMGHEIDNE